MRSSGSPMWVRSVVEGARASRCGDRIAVQHHGSNATIALADGAGGTGSAGPAAASDAVALATAHRGRAPSLDDLVAQLREIDRAIVAQGHGGMTTLVVLHAVEPTAAGEGVRWVGASVGDSRAWLLGEDGIQDLTQHQVRKPLLGSGDATPIGFSAAVNQRTLVVGSDGLFDYTTRDAIAACIARDGALACNLAQLVRLPGGGLADDLSIVVARPSMRVHVAADARPPLPAPPRPVAGLRILMVDNDAVFSDIVIEEFLATHQITRAASVAAALATPNVFDVVLCDYDLDDGKGDAVIRGLRARGFVGRIVAISSHAPGNAALRDAGADVVCGKLQFADIELFLRP